MARKPVSSDCIDPAEYVRGLFDQVLIESEEIKGFSLLLDFILSSPLPPDENTIAMLKAFLLMLSASLSGSEDTLRGLGSHGRRFVRSSLNDPKYFNVDSASDFFKVY